MAGMMVGVDFYIGDYIKTEAGFMRVSDVCEDCFGEMIVIFIDGSVMSLADVTIDNLFLESEVNL